MSTNSRPTRSTKSGVFWCCFAGILPWLIFMAGLYWAARETGSEGPGMLYYFLCAGFLGIVNIIAGGLMLARGRTKGVAVIFLWSAMVMGGLIPVGYLLILILQVY